MNFKKYIGRPYETYNCFDLVKEFYLDNFGLTLAHFWEGTEVPSRGEVESLVISNKGNFYKVDMPTLGDVIVLKLYGLECHIGVCISDRQFLHSARGTGSILDTIRRYQPNMVAGFYRHRERK